MGRNVRNLSPSEALFAFTAWLTTREKPTTMSASHDAAPIAELVKLFYERQGLAEPRNKWENAIVPIGEE